MNTRLIVLALMVMLAMTLMAPAVAAQSDAIVGTWSGNWTLAKGGSDYISLEVKRNDKGGLTGRFLTPVPIEFSEISFDAKTKVVAIDAADPKSGKHHRVDGKVDGNRLTGTLIYNDAKGTIFLTKWTFFP